MRQTKIIDLIFNDSRTTTARVHFNQHVKSIRVLDLVYENSEDINTTDKETFGYLSSNLGDQDSILGIYYQNKNVQNKAMSPVQIDFDIPKVINSVYTFTISELPYDDGFDKIHLLLEFIY